MPSETKTKTPAAPKEPKPEKAPVVRDLPDAAIAVIVAARHFGKGDALSALPTSLSADGTNWAASLQSDGSVLLLKEADRHTYDANRARLSGTREAFASAHRRWNSAVAHLGHNPDATPDMREKLQANVDRFKKEVDDLQAVIDGCYEACPALHREKLDQESARLVAQAKALEEKAAKLRQNAENWRAMPNPMPAEAVAIGAGAEDRSEIKAQECEAEADRIEAEARAKRDEAADKDREASQYPEGPKEQQWTLKPGETVSLTL